MLIHARHLLAALLLLAAGIPSQAQAIFPGMDGPPLLDALVQAYKPDSVLDYSHARDTMYALIHNQGDSVACVYSGHRLYLKPGEDPSTWLYMNGSNDGINCEHTWPQSKGAQTGNPESDMHHLFPTRSAVNTARDNFPFAEVPDHQATQWYHLDQVQTTIPVTEIELYSERKNGTFEPREGHKGNVARAMFYFYTMYRAEADAADPSFFSTQQLELCAWHYLDPADSLEIARTWQIAGYQDGKPNPFAVDCTLAARTFCSNTFGQCPLVSATDAIPELPSEQALQIFPNPVINDFTLVCDVPGLLTISDSFGRTVTQLAWRPGQSVEIGSLQAGIYFLRFGHQTTKLLKL